MVSLVIAAAHAVDPLRPQPPMASAFDFASAYASMLAFALCVGAEIALHEVAELAFYENYEKAEAELYEDAEIVLYEKG